jgi:hypothetical protein
VGESAVRPPRPETGHRPLPGGAVRAPTPRGVLALVLKYDNVYVDISCHATADTYYRGLRALLDRLSAGDAGKLTQRILFGSGFAVNLMWIESYNRYLDLFSRTAALTAAEKHAFCSIRPERFLFQQ